MTTDEWLDKLGPEQRLSLEKDRQTFFLNALMKITEVFKCREFVNETNKEFPMIKFLETFYDAGFYNGFSYGIDVGEHHVVEDSDIALKYSKEISDEINKEILSDVMTNNNNF